MDTERALTLAIVAAVVVAALPAAWALTTTVPVSGDIPVTTSQTPTVTLETGGGADLDVTSFFNGDELDIDTPQGNITVSGDSGASAHIALADIEGSQTQVTQIDAGGNWIELNPDDKQRVDVRGDADTLSFQSVAVNDGSTDLQVGGTQGGTAELRIHDLTAGADYALYDPNRDEVLGTGTADGSGVLQTDVGLPDGTQTLEVRTASDFAAPDVSNPTPAGQVTERPQNLSVDVTAEAWPATVNISFNGTQIKSTEITQNQTVNASLGTTDLGTYDWNATITDAVGATDTESVTYTTPTNLTFREEHDTTQFINNTDVELRFFTVEGDIAISRTATNGTVDMEGLPDSSFIVFAESENHYARTIYVDSIY
jgi:hypothetical protein